MILIKILLFYFTFKISAGEVRDCTICYSNFTNMYEDLMQRKPPVVGEVRSLFQNLTYLEDKINHILSNTPNLDHLLHQNEETKQTLNTISGDLNEVQNRISELRNHTGQYEDLIKKLEDAAKDLKDKVILHKNTRDECEKAQEGFENLKRIITLLKKLLDTVRIYQGSKQLKEELDSLEMPDYVYSNFICNSKLVNTIDEIISSIRRNIDLFRKLMKGIYDAINEKINNLNIMINEMSNSLDKAFEEMPETDYTFDKETPKLIPKVEDKLEELSRRLKTLKEKVQEKIDGYIEEKKLENQKRLDEYELVLEMALAARQKKIKDLNDDLKKKNYTKSLKELKKINETLVKGKVCHKQIPIED